MWASCGTSCLMWLALTLLLLLTIGRVWADWHTRHGGNPVTGVMLLMLLAMVLAQSLARLTRTLVGPSPEISRLASGTAVHPPRLEAGPGPTGFVIHHVAGLGEVVVEVLFRQEERRACGN